MKRTSIRRAIVPGVAVLALAITGCSAGNDSGSEGGDGGESSSDLAGELSAGGASSQEAAQNAWRVGFTEANPDVTVNYDPVGSGGGRESFISAAFPFAGSDAYLVDDEESTELTDATERCNGDAPVEVPNYISPIAIIFNVEGVDELNLTPQVLAGIFAGQITSWDAPEIAELNPDATLPSADINPVHRSDESGTTENFTNYLDTVAGDVWTAGEVETWPGEFGGEGANQTNGVVSAVRDGQNSIGYADASQAGDLAVANIGTEGSYVGPTPEAAAAILDASPRVEGRAEHSIVFDLDYNAEGAYPIVLTSYLIACQSYTGDEAEAGELTKAYLAYVVSEEGQQFGAEEAGSAPLSDELRSEVEAAVESITVE